MEQVGDRLRRPVPTIEPPKATDQGSGPGRPVVPRPDTKQLIERMRRVDPNLARRYRQRSGE